PDRRGALRRAALPRALAPRALAARAVALRVRDLRGDRPRPAPARRDARDVRLRDLEPRRRLRELALGPAALVERDGADPGRSVARATGPAHRGADRARPLLRGARVAQREGRLRRAHARRRRVALPRAAPAPALRGGRHAAHARALYTQQ